MLALLLAALVVGASLVSILAFSLDHSPPQPTVTSSTGSTASASVAVPSNESFQFVGAKIMNQSDPHSALVNATYTNELSQPQSANIVGVAYPTRASICCPIVRSYSTNATVSVSARIDASPHGDASTSLVFPGLNATGIYWVRISAVSLDGTTVLSPVSYVLLETAGVGNDIAGGGNAACGGEEGAGPLFIDSTTGHVYVADSGTDAVSVLDESNGRLVATISLPRLTGQLGFLPESGDGKLYVSSADSSTVYVVDTSTNFVSDEMSRLNAGATFVGSADGKDFVVLNGNASAPISVIDETTSRVVANISGIQSPLWSAYSSNNDELYVETSNQTVFAVSLNDYRVAARIPIPYSYNTRFLYDPGNGLLYAATVGSPHPSIEGPVLLVINSSSNSLLKASTHLPPAPNGTLSSYSDYEYSPVFYNPSNKEVYFYGMDSWSVYDTNNPDRLVALDTSNNSVVASIPVWGVAGGTVVESPSFFLDSSTGNVYATTDLNPSNGSTGLLEISRTNQVVSHVKLSGFSFGGYDLAFDLQNHVIFGAAAFSNVLMIDASSGRLKSTAVLGTCSFESPLP